MTLGGAELAVAGKALKATEAVNAAREISVMRDLQVQQGFRLGEISHQDIGGRMFADAGEKQAAEKLQTELNECFDYDAGSIEKPVVHDGGMEKELIGNRSSEIQLQDVQTAGTDTNARHFENVQARSSLEQEYLSDLKERSTAPFDVPADTSQWDRQPSTEIARKRLEWTQQKTDVISGWEQRHGTEWPRYKADVYDEKTGTKIRLAGDRFDGHHIRPLEYGGQNSSENIVPLHANDHYDHRGIHNPDSPLSRLGKLMEA
jgi:predicted ribonuclease toxin of YeeF-YezG toxin-antitoxin module